MNTVSAPGRGEGSVTSRPHPQTPWTPEEFAEWLAGEQPSQVRRLAGIPATVHSAWAAAFQAYRDHIVRRAPECIDYRRLMADIRDTGGFSRYPMLSPPPPDEARAAVDRDVALLWARGLEPKDG